MENSMIETLDKSRYNMNKWMTIGWTAWYGSYVLQDLMNNKLLLIPILLIGLIGWVLLFVNLLRFLKLGKMIKADHKLKEALSDELFRHNRDKACKVGFITLTILVGLFLVISNFIPISALLVCKITLYFGVLSVFIAGLVYNRG